MYLILYLYRNPNYSNPSWQILTGRDENEARNMVKYLEKTLKGASDFKMVRADRFSEMLNLLDMTDAPEVAERYRKYGGSLSAEALAEIEGGTDGTG